MASLNFDVLKKKNVSTTGYIYSDLRLDIVSPVKRDLDVDYDETAIRNSIINLFNTLPGQNLLNPDYGLNLLQYLFSPATTTVARIIGDKILRNIRVYEPRIRVQNVDVEVNPDEQMYTVTLSILIPSLNRNLKFAGILTKNGFTTL